MKKCTAIILIVFILTGCQRGIVPNHNEIPSKQPEETQTNAATATSTATATDTPTPTPTPAATKAMEISNGNLSNMGKVVEYDGWLYYTDYNDDYKFKRQALDRKKTEILSNAAPFYIHIYEDWLIYMALWDEEGGDLVKSRLDGTEKVILSIDEYGVSNVRMHNSDIYYISEDDLHIYKISINGDERQLICDDTVRGFNIINGKLLIRGSSEEGERYLAEYDLKNKDCKIIGDGKISVEWEHENRYYGYMNTNESNYIYSMNLDGTDIREVPNIEGEYFNFSDGWVYYSNSNDEYALYKARIDGSEITKLSSSDVDNIYIYGNTIYYVESYAEQIYKMSTDGGESELVN